MKKVLAMCVAVSFLATGCEWFRKKPNQPQPEVVTVTPDDSGAIIDTSGNVPDNTVVQDTNKNAGKRI